MELVVPEGAEAMGYVALHLLFPLTLEEEEEVTYFILVLSLCHFTLLSFN